VKLRVAAGCIRGNSGCSLRSTSATPRSSGPPPGGGCGPLRLHRSRKFKIQYSKLGALCLLGRKFLFQNSRFKQLSVLAEVLSASSVAQRPAARSRPRAEGCNLALLESRPLRSAAGFLHRINRVTIDGDRSLGAAEARSSRPTGSLPAALRRLQPEPE